MIFAAGRGERLRPLTDTCPKPLLQAGGKALIVWQIEALAAAGFDTIVINHAWLGEQLEAALGDGSRWHVTLHFSAEASALETAGGIAHALPLLCAGQPDAVFVAVSGDVFSDYDYRLLDPAIARLQVAPVPAMHLVMVPNPPYHPTGDFALHDGRLSITGARLTFGNIGVYDTRMFRDLASGARCALSPYFRAAIEAGVATGERHDGQWDNIGTAARLQTLDQRLRGRATIVR